MVPPPPDLIELPELGADDGPQLTLVAPEETVAETIEGVTETIEVVALPQADLHEARPSEMDLPEVDLPQVGLPEVKLGILPGYGGSQRLARLCGKGVAHELCLTGEMITAEEAQRIGLVNHIYEPAELIPAAEAMAKKIIANAPLGVKYTMEAIERGVEMPQEEGLFLEATLFGLACATEDMREGTKAFLEKRPPQFKGK
jgi:hypothetical protein